MDDQFTGAAREGVGRVQDAVGGLTGDSATQMKGKLNQAAGDVQQTYGKLSEGVRDTLEGALETVRGEVHERLDTIETYVKDRPLPALAIAAVAGIVLGLLLRGGSRTIYLRDPR
ncbi:hypothetical protein DMC25_00840 [Caulobacter sp. D4A]|uniref:CsbD family protein n=1 Tax=unclassified Caulobacter TaxID=2648921 RepID=UPI000D737EF3|nr:MULTISPECIES: CsbD family protein [unclassified Caulobacter]PXA94779.1 hypothetical protein DMC18_05715 [Caulobacter sp. D5]PXA95378.1 hypothetical protein DMC25_00840 [Caulobacter sp. D4A]